MSTPAFGSWFKHQLARRGWSQSEFHRRAGVPRSTVSTWAQGHQIPEPLACDVIAEAFGMDRDLVLAMAGHRPVVDDELSPDDPRTDLIALVRRVSWDAEREAIARAVLEAMVKQGKRKG